MALGNFAETRGGGAPQESMYDHLYEGTQQDGTGSIQLGDLAEEVGLGIGQTLRLVIRSGGGSNPDAVTADLLITRVAEGTYQMAHTPKRE